MPSWLSRVLSQAVLQFYDPHRSPVIPDDMAELLQRMPRPLAHQGLNQRVGQLLKRLLDGVDPDQFIWLGHPRLVMQLAF